MRMQAVERGLLAIIVLSIAACQTVPSYAPLAQHTLTKGDNQEDVVWLLYDTSTIVRCHGTDRGPVCVTVTRRE